MTKALPKADGMDTEKVAHEEDERMENMEGTSQRTTPKGL